ncbi:zinc finger protein with KRAB and SCAN domains 8-like [Galleria mellonella]|uniref:Zinc finger protein with KRAB and SCAN domains 8-like n=1 Tax=Galleria mellonella TaxID=7137 RepID=A0A6J1WB95_GALME|nr:zinc finger protein with KRAB and SCAN domains 8-like [Galleria mellonella]XP_052759179.1 zinc finger protein with KRAB and SCAN domains 8-like [Galleria mellonella]
MDTWSNLCRCCLSPDSQVSLLDEHNVTEKFHEVTSIEVKLDDGLPQKLCNDCFAKMNSAYQFRKQCIKMDSELKLQLNTLLTESYIQQAEAEKNQNFGTDIDDIANDPIKQLESIIKKEPTDSDDDYYYVLVIDDPKDKEKQNETESSIDTNIKLENIEDAHSLQDLQEILNEPIKVIPEATNTFEGLNSIDSFLVSNPKVPVNVPATILQNEEDSQENDNNFTHPMDIEETQDSASQEQMSAVDMEENEIVENIGNNIISTLPTSKNIIKILTTSSADGTILLKNNDKIQYLTDNDELMTNNDGLDQEEVIFCEDDATQYQIIKCDGTELVIEYSDDGQIATVLQQEDGTFLCECGEQFEDLAEYEKHQYKHNPAGEHLCNLCGKGFESAEILTGHILLHSFTGLLITCPFCNHLVRRNALTQHIKYGHNNIKPRCDQCFKTFANPNNLKRHMMIHTGVREFECDICFKRFHQKITMQTHRLTHLNPFTCNQCDHTFNNKAELSAHRNSEECTKSKAQKVKVELMKTVKQEITTNLGKLLGYACSLCKKMFSLESALEQHVESTHIVDPAELLCSECGEVLPSKKDMQAHILNHKNMKPKIMKRFECSMCGKGCSSQAMLIMHERVHTNERPFPCQLCSLRFKTKTHLRTHQLTHTREKKFGCSVCMKFFALKGNLVVHLRTHTGERPYICTLCGEAFIDSKYLKKHKLKKHAIDNVPWNKY